MGLDVVAAFLLRAVLASVHDSGKDSVTLLSVYVQEDASAKPFGADDEEFALLSSAKAGMPQVTEDNLNDGDIGVVEDVVMQQDPPRVSQVPAEAGVMGFFTQALETVGRAVGVPVRHPELKKNMARRSEVYRENLGIRFNGYGDLASFTAALAANGAAVVTLFALFCVLRLQFPIMFSGNTLGEEPRAKYSEHQRSSVFGWVDAIKQIWLTSHRRLVVGDGGFNRFDQAYPSEVENVAGMDRAMLIQYCTLAQRLCLVLGIPLVFCAAPLNYFFGGMRADNDRLSQIGFSNIVEGHPLCWVYAFVVWATVAVVQHHIFEAQRAFLNRRVIWLQRMSYPRSHTVLVQFIPQEYRCDSRLKAYFNKAFDDDVVERAYCIRKTGRLDQLLTRLDEACASLKEAEEILEATGVRPQHFSISQASRVDSMNQYRDEMHLIKNDIHNERARLQAAISSGNLDRTAFTCHGLVTFKKRQISELALKQNFTPDMDEFLVSVPPDPFDIDYQPFQAEPMTEAQGHLMSYLAMAGIFFAFLPVVVCICSTLKLEHLRHQIPLFNLLVKHYPFITTMWDGVVGAAALTGLMSFIPTFIALAVNTFCYVRSAAWVQHKIQVWYFYFLFVFVLLVTGIGTSLVASVKQVWISPSVLFKQLAIELPKCTHFYLKFLPAQWSSTALVLTRYVPVVKYQALRQIFDEGRAKELAEPEDQDWYGVGGRSARLALYLNIVIVLSTLSPIITILGWITFFLLKVVYTYLFVYAETEKADLGGIFWCTQLKHTQQGLYVYVALMTGVLFQRSESMWPGLIALSSLLFLIPSCLRFDRAFNWEYLPFSHLVDEHAKSYGSYEQPDLAEHEYQEMAQGMVGTKRLKAKTMGMEEDFARERSSQPRGSRKGRNRAATAGTGIGTRASRGSASSSSACQP